MARVNMKNETREQLEATYKHMRNYMEYEESTTELREMCKNCERYCGLEHDYEECREMMCFKFWLAFKYLEWSNSWGRRKMARLVRTVDIEALISEIDMAISQGYCARSLEDMKHRLSQIPTVDAVEVVRCKDCKYWGGRHASNECSLITKLGNPDYWLKTLPTDYCSSGAKMDGGVKE